MRLGFSIGHFPACGQQRLANLGRPVVLVGLFDVFEVSQKMGVAQVMIAVVVLEILRRAIVHQKRFGAIVVVGMAGRDRFS